jgi:NADH-quinone oxidoreductase subunit M
MIRFVVPLFPGAFEWFAPAGMAIGVIGIIYGALLAYAQTDLKRLVAYTSVSHMGFVLLGICAWNTIALQGVVMQMICHGIGTGALFIMVGALQERIHTRDLRRMGGLWPVAPVMGAIGVFFAMASLGLPGMGSFIGEFLILVGAYKASLWMVVFASIGLIAATIYSLRIVHLVFHGAQVEPHVFPDYSPREIGIMGALIVSMMFLGLYPRPVTGTAAPALQKIEQVVESASKAQVTFLRDGFPVHRGDVS